LQWVDAHPTEESLVTDQPTPAAEPSREHLDRAREEHAASAREQAERSEQAREDEAQQVWSEMEGARDRAEAMGDRVEDGTRETGTGSRSREE